MKKQIILLIFLPILTFSHTIFKKKIQENLVEFSDQGIMRISTDTNTSKENYYQLQLNDIAFSPDQHGQLTQPTITIKKEIAQISYQWNKNITETWKIDNSDIYHIITINKKPRSINSKLPLTFYLSRETNMDNLCVGGICTYYNEDGYLLNHHLFNINDKHCKQLSANKQDNPNYIRYSIDEDNLHFPITLKSTIHVPPNKELHKSIKAVAVNGKTLALSYHYNNMDTVEIYKKSSSSWKFQKKIESNSKYSDFGNALALTSDTLAIAARFEDTSSPHHSINSGAVYIYVEKDQQWKQQAYIKPPQAGHANWFGDAIDLQNNTLIIGSPETSHHGLVYVYTRNQQKWQQTAIIGPNNLTTETEFGKAVALDHNTLVIGGRYEINKPLFENIKPWNFGQFYVFSLKNNVWKKQLRVKIGDLKQPLIQDDFLFAHSVDIEADTIVIGSPSDFYRNTKGINNDNKTTNSGSAYIFNKKRNKWRTHHKQLKALDSSQWDHFGNQVKIKGGTIIIAASGQSSNCLINSSGAVYIFNRSFKRWKQTNYLKSATPRQFGFFGQTLDYDGKSLVVGPQHIELYTNHKNSLQYHDAIMLE